MQLRLIVLDREDAVPALGDDLRGDVTLTTHGDRW